MLAGTVLSLAYGVPRFFSFDFPIGFKLPVVNMYYFSMRDRIAEYLQNQTA